MNILKVNNLCKNYETFSLNNVSFELREGKITGFIGRNGAGKTTTIKSILDFVHPDGGSIDFFDKDFKSNQIDIKQQIGYVSGGVNFYPLKKLKKITKVTKSFYSNWDDETYKKCLRKFHLDENKTPVKLSEGMKVKYSLALALSHNAKLLILDEPTSGLDPVSRDELLDIFLELQREGTTIFFSTHITSDLDKCADDIIYIHNGKILATDELKHFAGKYLYVELSDGEYENINKDLLIGAKPAKEGYVALVLKENEDKLPVKAKPADLETIMIHLEKEGEQ